MRWFFFENKFIYIFIDVCGLGGGKGGRVRSFVNI